jgi:hypothetical protein
MEENEQDYGFGFDTDDIAPPSDAEEPFFTDYDYQEFTLNIEKPLVLLLGRVGGEGTLNLLTTTKRQYKKKLLESTPENWETIIEYFDLFEINSVLIKISDSTFHNLYDPTYDKVKKDLFSRIAKTRHIVFVEEHTLSRVNISNVEMVNSRLPKVIARSVLEWLEESDIDITPFGRTAEMNVLSEHFLIETEKNLIFRMYIPKGRIWSEQTEKLLQLFKDYLGRVSKIKTRLDQRATDNGTVYEFHGEEEHSDSSMQEKFKDFTSLMDLCNTDIAAAEELLRNVDINQSEASSIITKFSKEAKRLQLDIKHESETKTLALRHRMESELTDIVQSSNEKLFIENIVNSIIPSVFNTSLLSAFGPAPVTVAPNNFNNASLPTVRNQIINIANIAISQEIRGNQFLGAEDVKIIELISQYGGNAKANLESAVHELADPGIPDPERLGAKQKIKKFLFDVGSKATDIGVGVLQSYIESKLGL